MFKTVFAGALLTPEGKIIPSSIKTYTSQCEEWCLENLPEWPSMQKKGARIANVEIAPIEETELRVASTTASLFVAIVINDLGQVLPYSAQATTLECEAWARENFAAWDKLKELGGRVITAKVYVVN